MKKIILSAIFLAGSFAITKAQNKNTSEQIENNEDAVIAKNEKETYLLNNSYNFTISKIDNKTNKKIFDVVLNIPNKEKKEYYYPTYNKISTVLIDNEIQIIYDVWNKKDQQKECYIKHLDIKGSPLSEEKLLLTVECKSAISNGDVNYRVIYSPDKLKFAILLDNYAKGFTTEPSITIYDSKKATPLSIKKLKSMYNGQKIQIDPYNNFKMDNVGNINLLFNALNEKTNLVLKSFQAEIPFSENDMKNIKEINESTLSDTSENTNKLEQGRFYNSLEDYANNKFIEGYKVKNEGLHSAITGDSFDLINKKGEIDKTNVSDLPSSLFTYKKYDVSDFYLIRADKGKIYIVKAAGKFCYYSSYFPENMFYYSEGINGELKKYKEKILEDYLEKYNLLEDYLKDKPKSLTEEFKRRVKYINLLNKKM